MSSFFRSDLPGQKALPLARAGYPFIFGCVFITIVFALLGLVILSLIGLVATFFICYFFRDPDRVIPNDAGCIVSPADGMIVAAGLVDNTLFFDGSCMKISIFMSIFNVHVNRIPYEGRIKEVQYHPGKFFSANLDKASANNERNAVFIETEGGKNICTVQVAGLIARRIICKVQKGNMVERGQRFGLICFGSRLDVYLPPGTHLKVATGDKVKAGTSVLGDLQ
jgi:phosphatidylserine decarboxylase